MDIEDDDEFGDLYTDLLRPIPAAAAARAPPAAAPSDALIGAGAGGDVDGDDDDDILYGSSNIDVQAPPAQTLAPLAADDVDEDWMLGDPPDTVEDPASWDDEVEEIPSKSEQIPGLNLAPSIKSKTFRKSSVLLEHDENSEIGNEDPVIPGLGAAPVMNCSETRRSRSDESDSDSEDDLQIVLNDAHHGPVAAAQMNMNLQNDEDDNDDDDDEDGDDFVIVANKDQQHHHHAVMEGQEWVEEATQPGGDGETKDAAESGKGVVATAGVVGPRLGYGGHGFHSQHHSMYKYVRPGAAPGGGAAAAASVGAPAQIRPQLTIAPLAGRGRGDWRPALGRGISAVQKSFHPGSGLAPLGGMSNRVTGIGLDFTLPSHKSVFDVDIDSFEEKPWRLPGVDISDFFNFGLDEDKWKEYCKRLEQLRLESTMQSKIRVYESGRSEQEHDPDLPPELAAAAGLNDTTSENLRGRSDVGQADLMGQGRGVSRAPMLTGRAIQVESGYGERLPSIDTRPPRIRDSDAIIEIVCQDFVDDMVAAVEQPRSELDREHIKGGDETPGDDEPAESENHDSFSQTVSSRGREPSNRRAAFTPERDDSISSFPPEAALQSHSTSNSRGPAYSNPHERRLPSRRSRGRYPNASAGHSIDVVASQSEHVKQHDRDRVEISEESMDANDASAPVSPAVVVENAKDVSPEQVDIDDNDEKLALGDSIEVDGEDVASDTRISFGTAGNDSLAQSSKKQKLSSRVEQPVIEDYNEGEELKITQSDSGRGKPRKEKDNRKQHESGEVSDGKSRRGSDLRRHHDEDEHRHRRKDDYGRDGRQEIERSRAASRGYVDAYHSHAQRDLDANMIHPTRGRIELHERSKERDSSVSVWHRKDSEIHNRRLKEEEIRRDQGEDLGWKHRSKNRGGELKDRNEDMHFRKHIDDGDYRLRDREGASRQREREELLLVRRDEISDPLLRRRGEDEHLRRDKMKKEDTLHGHRLRDDSTRRKKERERDDGPDRRRREDTIRARDKPEDHHSSRHKDENWYQKEREDRQRLKQPQEEVQKHGDREGRGASRNGVGDHKTSGNTKTRDESKKLGFTDNHHKDRRRNENSRGDQNGEEISHHRAREGGSNNDNRVSEEERISRRERSSSHNDHLSNISNNNHMNQDRQRASTRQKSENEASQVNFQSQNKRKREDNSAQLSELVNKKVRSEQQRRENGPSLDDETLPQAQNSILDQGEVASDDEYSDSRRGRSKLERWTSHKERDYSAVDNRRSFSSSSRVKVISDATTDMEKEHTGELGKSEANATGELEVKDSDVGPIPEKKEDLDKHLDTVAKLKRRSERFNLPMPGEKDVTGSKKNHNELPAQTETTADADVKPERPARKRKWTSG